MRSNRAEPIAHAGSAVYRWAPARLNVGAEPRQRRTTTRSSSPSTSIAISGAQSSPPLGGRRAGSAPGSARSPGEVTGTSPPPPVGASQLTMTRAITSSHQHADEQLQEVDDDERHLGFEDSSAAQPGRGPKMAVPIRTRVAPSATAALEVVGHAHRQLRAEPRVRRPQLVAQPAQRREGRAAASGASDEPADGHQAVHAQRAAARGARRSARSTSPGAKPAFAGSSVDVDLEEHRKRPAGRPRRRGGRGAAQLERVDRLDDVEQLDGAPAPCWTAAAR